MLTNEEKIKSMNTSELAQWLKEFKGDICFGCPLIEDRVKCSSIKLCSSNLETWLKNEAD